jgi:hypothetical protein
MPKNKAALRPALVEPRPSMSFVATLHPPMTPITLNGMSRADLERITSEIKQKVALVQWLAFAQAHNHVATHEAYEEDAWWCIEDLLRDITSWSHDSSEECGN